MAMTAYLKLEGSSQGDIAGEVAKKGKENLIEVYRIDHKIEVPRDMHSGLPTGQRIHHPMTLLTKVGSQTPKTMQACTTAERMSKFELQLFRIDDAGKETNYYTIELHNAIIVQDELQTPETFLSENKVYTDMEVLQFSYSKIVHRFAGAGGQGTVETEDDWLNPSE